MVSQLLGPCVTVRSLPPNRDLHIVGSNVRRIIPLLIFSLWLFECRADNATSNSPSEPTSTAKAANFQFDGVWKPKGALLRGTLLPPPALDTITLQITGDRYEVTVTSEAQSDTGIFILDETVTPMRMAIKSLAGPNKGQIILAIYEIKGADAMRVCYDLSGKAFPTEFKAPKDSDRYLVGYRRQKSVEQTREQTSSQSKASSASARQ